MMTRPEERLRTIDTALARLKREDAAEGVNFTLDERVLVIAALEVAHEIVAAVLDGKRKL